MNNLNNLLERVKKNKGKLVLSFIVICCFVSISGWGAMNKYNKKPVDQQKSNEVFKQAKQEFTEKQGSTEAQNENYTNKIEELKAFKKELTKEDKNYIIEVMTDIQKQKKKFNFEKVYDMNISLYNTYKHVPLILYDVENQIDQAKDEATTTAEKIESCLNDK